MRKYCLTILAIVISFCSFAQTKTAEDFGYRHIVFDYKGDSVDILVKSAEGEENVPKPIFFFCQGSLPKPLIKLSDENVYGVFPFDPDLLTGKYHLVIVGKPHIPLIARVDELDRNFNYLDSLGRFPHEYSIRNHLDYYTKRNIAVMRYLQKQHWALRGATVVAGHSEGSTVAAKMASETTMIARLIYAGGNPVGRMTTIVGQSRRNESYDGSKASVNPEIKYWESVVADPENAYSSQGDSNLTTYSFSYPAPIQYLRKVRMPVLICYGTKDYSAPFNDYLWLEAIREKRGNFSFRAYVGTEHNFFPLKEDGTPGYDVFNWDNVALDWLEWLTADTE